MSTVGSPKQGLTRRKTVTQEKKITEDEFMAAAIGDVEWLRQSLRGQKGTINFDRNGLAPIHLAAIHGRVDCLRLLVEKFKVDVNTPSATGWRPVHLCISNQTGRRAFQSLQYLLDKSADPSIPNDDGITPMHQAASEGHVQCLKALIEAGGKVWEKDDRGHTPIDLAKLWGHRKCARILATENWHQSKEFLAKEMSQLQKIKMQQVMEEIEKEDEIKQDQALYGEMAFNEWLTNRAGAVQKLEGKGGKLKALPAKPDTAPKESVQKANSKRRPPGGAHAPSPIQEEPVVSPRITARRRTFVSPQHDRYGSASSQQEDADKAKAASEATKQTTVSQEVPLHLDIWNTSTKVMEKIYESNLVGHYPHDEYTMMPVNPPVRKDFSTSKYGQNRKPKEIKMRMPILPPDVIDKKLHPEKYERPVVYKCRHIADVQKREHYPEDTLPRQEIGLHIMDDMQSSLFKRALLSHNKLLGERPSAATSLSSMLEQARISQKSSREGEKFAEFMSRMTKPTNYPSIHGKEYPIPNTAGV